MSRFEMREDQPLNRKARRGRQYRNSGEAAHLDALNKADAKLHKASRARNDLVDQTKPFLYTTLIYQNGGTMLEYLSAARTFSLALEKLKPEELDYEAALHFERDEIFTHRVNGVTLREIEGMGDNLGTKQIGKVNKMLRRGRWEQWRRKPESSLDVLAKEQLIVAALYPHATGIPLPETLKPLHNAATSYYDYYIPYLTTDSAGGIMDYLKVMHAFGQTGLTLVNHIGAYIPAHYGITASSAVKLIKERSEFCSKIPGSKKAQIMYETMALQAGEAYTTKKSLQDSVSPYEKFDSSNEIVVAKTLNDYYSGSFVGRDTSNLEDVANQLKDIDKNLNREINRGKEKSFRMDLDHPLFEEVKVAKRGPTQIFIGILKDKNHHLLLEVNNRSELFGIPHQVSEEIPHAAQLLAADLMTPVVDEIERRYAVAPEIILPAKFSSEAVKINDAPTNGILSATLANPQQEGIASRLVHSLLTLVPQEPSLPHRADHLRPVYNVNHTKSQIRMLAGVGTSDDQILEIMEAIRKFEYGQFGKSIREENGRKTAEIPVAGRIVTLRFMGGEDFRLTKVKKREFKLLRREDSAQEQKEDQPLFNLAHPMEGYMGEDSTTPDFTAQIYPKELDKYGEPMFKDVVLMLDSLREQPKGTGIFPVKAPKAVVDKGVIVDKYFPTSALRLREFRGDARGLKFTHPEARRIRIASYIHPTVESTLVIQDILHHNDWDGKYALQKGS